MVSVKHPSRSGPFVGNGASDYLRGLSANLPEYAGAHGNGGSLQAKSSRYRVTRYQEGFARAGFAAQGDYSGS